MRILTSRYLMSARTSSDLVADLRAAGVREGDDLVVHSSFKAVGPVVGGVNSVIEALLESVGPRGNVMVPTFTYSMPMWQVPPFNWRESESRVGAITEQFRLRVRAKRSFHPTHSVAVIGPDAEALTANHLHSTPIGAGSPLARMAARGAKILMLGTHQDTNSTLHYAEVLAGVPYLNTPFSEGQDFELAWFVNENGEMESIQVFECPGCSRGFRAVEGPLREMGVLRDVKVGAAATQLLASGDVVEAVAGLLRRDPALLLCNIASCAICPKRRAKCY